MGNKNMALRLSLGAAALVFLFGSAAAAQISGKLVNPNVLLVIDSSGSMDWLVDHPESASQSWLEAQLECAAANDPTAGDARRTSWQQIQDVMLGEIPPDQFHCFLENPEIRPAIQATTIESEDVNTYIKEYRDVAHNHYRSVACSDANWNDTYGQCVGPTIGVDYTIMSTGHACKLIIDTEQNYFSATGTAPELCYNYHDKALSRPTNGILERYRTLARFGIMTYDNKPAPATLPADPPLLEEHDGLWNYGESRQWDCKQWYTGASVEGKACTWNAGARAANANAVGPMVPINGDLEASNRGIREVLNTAEPLYCSPMGALLDDVGYYFHNDPAMQPASTSVGSDIYFNCRPKVVIFISDGQPTPDFEFPQAYCDDNPPVAPDGIPSTDPYSCPWNSSLREVQELHDLIPLTDGVDPILLVVIGFNAGDRGDVDCAGTHTWDCIDLNWNTTCDPGEPYECNAPDPKCVQVGVPATEAECLAGEYNDGMSTKDAFITPRQFLNQLALTGWPVDWDPLYLEAPWRSTDLTFCDDDEDNCGGEDGDPSPWDDDGAIFVNSAGELSAILDLILSKITATVATRTEVVTTDQIDGNLDTGSIETGGVAQFEFNSGFEVIGGKPWRGYLYRQGYSCVQDGVGGEPVDDTLGEFHEFLKNQGTRDIWTIGEDQLDLLNYGSANNIKYGSDILAQLTALDDCDVGGPMPEALCGGKSDIRDQVKTHLHGDVGSARDEHPLADIYNSTPAILGPPMERLPIASYDSYRSQEYTDAQTSSTVKRMNRPPYLYVGTGDSVLHSFKVWGEDGDVETWGFVPHTLLNTVWKQFPISWTLTENPVTHLIDDYVVEPLSDDNGIYQHYFGVDGAPVAADLRLWRNPDDTLNEEVDKWRSVVLGSFGKGAVGYYCLDVTNPSATPRFRWEISERTAALGVTKGKKLAGNNDSSVFTDGSEFGMGVPLGKPAVAYVFIDTPIPGGTGTNELHEEAVAILPGGYKNDENGGPETSTGVYIVRVADGEVIRYLDPSNVDDICGGGDAQTAQLVGTPAVPVGSRSATVADEAFMGDDRGRLWRIGMAGDDPDTDWCLQMYFDTLITHHYPYKDCVYPGSTYAPGSNDCCTAKNSDPTAECTGMLDLFAIDDDWGVDACTGLPCDNADYPFPRIPIIRAPTIVQDRDRNNIIIFGTGQLDALETLNHNRIFSLTENINYVVEVGGGAANTEREPPEINWWIGEEDVSAEMVNMTPVGDLRTQAQSMNDTIAWFDGASAPTIQGVFFNMGEKMLGRPVVFEDVAYFVTYIPAILDSGTLDGCESGGSRIWGVNFGPPDTGPSTPWSSVTEFGRLSWDTSDPPDGTLDVIDLPFRDYENELLSGLKMVRRPSCSGETTFELVAQRAATQEQIAATPAGSNVQQVTSVTMPVQSQRAGFTTVQINSWSLVFN